MHDFQLSEWKVAISSIHLTFCPSNSETYRDALIIYAGKGQFCEMTVRNCEPIVQWRFDSPKVDPPQA